MSSRLLAKPGVVSIWGIRLDVEARTVRALADYLGRGERESVMRLRYDYLRRRFIVRRAAYRCLLARYLDADPRQIEFKPNAFGKPGLTHLGIEHNASHSGDLALLAVTAGSTVGVDVEAVRNLGNRHEWLSPNERHSIEALPIPQQLIASLRLWTRKEAYMKALGVGVALLDSDMAVAGMPHAIEDNGVKNADWTVLDIGGFPHHVAAIATRAPAPTIECRAWTPATQARSGIGDSVID